MALDTCEPCDPGDAEVVLQLGLDGMGLRRAEGRLAAEFAVGFGVVERLSAYLAGALAGDLLLAGAEHELAVGLFGTPLETRHVDLDLFLEVGGALGAGSSLTLRPGLELNLDHHPEMESFGLFLQAGFPVFGAGDDRTEGSPAFVFEVELTVGAYLTVARRHQILLGLDAAFRPWPAEGELRAEVGGLALGYNVMVTDVLELLAEARLDIPQGDEPVAAAFAVGLIGTIPASPSPSREPEPVGP